MKKFRSIAAGLLAAFLLACPASAMTFPDVDSHSDYAAAVENISALKIMVGDNQGNFNPNQIVSRAEMAAIVCRMLGTTKNLPKTDVFTDVPTTHWANTYIGKASELGIVNGYGKGKFGPGDPVTYEQAVAMIVRALGEEGRAYSKGGYPNGYFQVAEENTLLEGVPAVQGQGLTRGTVAMLLNNHFIWYPFEPGDGHTHQYEEKALPGSGGGYYESVQVGTKTMNERGPLIVYKCSGCDFTTTDADEIIQHTTYAKWNIESPCWGVGCTWVELENEVIGTYEDPVWEWRWIGAPYNIVRVCTLCGELEQAEGHVHTYTASGHFEEGQIGTKAVKDYAPITIYGCHGGDFTTINHADMKMHGDARYAMEVGYDKLPHIGVGWWSKTETKVSGTHEEPVYGKRIWVEDIVPACSVCGQQIPS